MAARFPRGFRWGTATSAYQIEGAVSEDGRGASIWDVFSHAPGKIRDGSTGDVACDHYHRYAADVRLMKELGINTYRFSVAWPRIFPEGKGAPNRKGLAFYQRLLDALEAAGIESAVTLYHWDLPQALQERGGWRHRDTARRFADYAGFLFDRLGDRVSQWITICEPAVVALLGHVTGEHAPGLQDPVAGLAAAHHLLVAHGLALQAFRDGGRRRGAIGITLNLAPVHPASDRAEDVAAAERVDGILNRWFLEPLFKGNYPPEVVEWFGRVLSLPAPDPADMASIAQPMDFLGINYYTRHVVTHDPGEPILEMKMLDPSGSTTGIGWEVYPKGLAEVVERVERQYTGRLPLYITENGAAYPDQLTPDGAVHDPDRVAYLQAHLAQLLDLVERGAPVKGYFLWSLLDNFEWAHGYSQRFGIIYVDYPTQQRIWKDSARWYQRLVGEGILPG